MKLKHFHELGKVKRDSKNPILSPLEYDWANRKVYNAAVVKNPTGQLAMIFRAIGEDWISRLGFALIHNFSEVKANEKPVLIPSEAYDSHGIEDPRITYIDGKYWLTYVAYDGKCARVAIAQSRDLKNWHKIGSVFPSWNKGYWQKISHGENNWSKAGAIFPEKIDGKYFMLFGDDNIWPAWSKDLLKWNPSDKAVLTSRDNSFDSGYVEMGPPPIKTKKGWLVIYHGIQQYEDEPGNPRIYKLGAALLNIEDPTKVIWRCTNPILEPKSEELKGLTDAYSHGGGFESLKELTDVQISELNQSGKMPQAVFCCGAIKVKDTIHLYYSSMDTRINHGTIILNDIFMH